MVRRVAPRVEVFADLDAASLALARYVVASARAAERARGRFSIVLSGGRTPVGLYRRLAGPLGRRIPWAETDVYFADERCVAPHHPDSNFGSIWSTLLSRVPVVRRRVHRLRGEVRPPSSEAARYGRLIGEDGSGDLRFDLTLLGIGPDGHTASLFPDSPAARETRREVVSVRKSGQPPFVPRLTLTARALSSSRAVCFLVAGADKAAALAATLRARAPGDAGRPATRVRPETPVRWYVDRAAASRLRGRSRRSS